MGQPPKDDSTAPTMAHLSSVPWVPWWKTIASTFSCVLTIILNNHWGPFNWSSMNTWMLHMGYIFRGSEFYHPLELPSFQTSGHCTWIKGQTSRHLHLPSALPEVRNGTMSTGVGEKSSAVNHVLHEVFRAGPGHIIPCQSISGM